MFAHKGLLLLRKEINMEKRSTNKFKIINDPVFGFIKIRYELAFHIMEHPYFQRLRRIRQLGMTHFVYPGANHTRFQHALGAMHLMADAISTIRSKGHTITEEESEAAALAILLHDAGHGPFSHTLEKTIIRGVHHEEISLLIMEQLNEEFDGRLSMAIEIFTGKYPKQFLHQLVTGQLDVDRLDYLRRDSFFTGVTEGAIGSDRIIKMMDVVNDQLVIEEKGIYSIEKFLVARRLMYWQVYLHKGVLAGDQLLIMLLQRARDLAAIGRKLFATPQLAYFLYEHSQRDILKNKKEFLENFTALDDSDIISAAKVWSKDEDRVLSYLGSGFVDRRLFRIEISNEPFDQECVSLLKKEVATTLGIDTESAKYLVITESISNHAYSDLDDNIKILGKDGDVRDISGISEIVNVPVLSRNLEKYYLCFPKNLNS